MQGCLLPLTSLLLPDLQKFSVMTSFQKFDYSFIPKKLHLLANLRFNVLIVGMLNLQFVCKHINILQIKIFRRDSVYTVEYIKQPSTLFNRSRLQTFDSCIVLYDTILTAEILIFNNRDSPLFWNITVQNIATDPSSTSGSWR